MHDVILIGGNAKIKRLQRDDWESNKICDTRKNARLAHTVEGSTVAWVRIVNIN